MISKKLLTGLFAAGLTLGMISTTASAQYIGPTRVAPTTVNTILKSPVDDQYVLLSGKITSRISHDKYVFTDRTGSITAEIDDKVFAGRHRRHARRNLWQGRQGHVQGTQNRRQAAGHSKSNKISRLQKRLNFFK